MFILHSSNKTENLLIHLTRVLAAKPLASPFSKEVFLIQSQGMERWLSQQLASHFKVWGNYEFLFPGRFFNTLAQKLGSQLHAEDFDRERMLWRFEILLRNLAGEVFLPVQQYIVGENAALKRYQLAQQLAQVFDQYQMLRVDMLEKWEQNHSVYNTDTEVWQRALWQQLITNTGGKHRGALWQEAIDKLTSAPENSFADSLPERVSVFGLNTLPPLALDFLQGLAMHSQVHFYLLNPAQTFWADLQNKRQRARQNLYQETTPALGHPLLATLGQQGREFHELLLEQAEFELELESFEEETKADLNVLQHLQNDILYNQPPEELEPLQNDGSISIHACHSRCREVQVAKNLLLQALEDDHDLELRDIVVMAPKIEIYEPFINAEFADLQHAIADRSLRLSNPVLDSLISFLRLSQGRFGWQSVLDLLELPLVYSGFGLSETDLELIRHWIQEIHIRWGKSAQHKQQLALPASDANTWQYGLERLLMGYAMSDDSEFVDNILPYIDIEGASAEVLGGLYDFLQLLFTASSDLAREKSLQDWGEQLYFYADKLFAGAAVEVAHRQQLNELFSELTDILAPIHNENIPLEVIIAWLEEAISERKSANGFLRGQLTFCSMLPMRSIPFKVIVLLGMNEGEFPRIDRYPTFDLMGRHFLKGDRSHRADDRYQFLEILLSARQQLLITYIGQSMQNNEAIPPSVVISELLDILQDSYRLTNLLVYHPLQAFSRQYFQGRADLFSFSQADCDTATALSKPAQAVSTWWQGEIAAKRAEVIEVNDLFAFYRHPQRYFVQRKLSVFLQGLAQQADEREPFSIDGLDAYQIDQQWIEIALSKGEMSVDKLQAEGAWLSGVCGEIKFAQKKKDIIAFIELIRAKEMGNKIADLEIDVSLGHYRLVGKLPHQFQQGGLVYRYTNLKGKDLIQAWLQHLLSNQIRPQKTCLLSKDADLLFTPELSRASDLHALIEIYLQGQKHPNAFFVEAALAYIRQASNDNVKKPAIDAARENLHKALENGFEAELTLLYRHVEDIDALLGTEFEAQCQSLLQPLWEQLHAV
jgi:exodeoxyribonuclease V gamma subunit